MVYLTAIVENLRSDLLKGKDLTSLAYLFASYMGNVQEFSGILTGEEALAVKGYIGQTCTEPELQSILSKKPYKGFGITDNIYKLVGIHLASDGRLNDKVEQKFNTSSLKTKYFISKCLPEYREKLTVVLSTLEPNDLHGVLLNAISGFGIDDNLPENVLQEFIHQANDVIDLLLLEDIERYCLSCSITKTTYLKKDAKTLIIDVLSNFRESVKKVSSGRRKDHDEFQINDEYDVQDLLYVILKSIFPKLKEEDPTPKVGSKSNKIDLIIREEGILVEVKMIKVSDTNENKYVEELKNDIQSYHQCQWLEHLICFVYDPFDKTRSKQNFYDLNGTQSINGKSFEITLIVN